MKAPNKLFIKPEKIKVEMIPGGELPNVGIQYIRKVALPEWAKEEQAKCSSETHPYAMFMNVVIDKLNSM